MTLDLSLEFESGLALSGTDYEQSPGEGRWRGPYNNKFLSTYAYWGEMHEFISLEEAQGAALELLSIDQSSGSQSQSCGGITLENGNYTLRQGTVLEDSPSGETSWLMVNLEAEARERDRAQAEAALRESVPAQTGASVLASSGVASVPEDVSSKTKAPETVAEIRFGVIQALNKALSKALPLIDLCQLDKPGSLASLLGACRGLIFESIKTDMWVQALAQTAGGGGQFELKLSRPKARKFQASGKVDVDGRFLVFSQAFRAMHSMRPEVLRRSDRLYTTIFIGERAQDAGGPYRESFDIYCEELQSQFLPLLVRAQNGRQASGINREKWLLSPDAVSPTHLEMLCFLGKLMATAMRSQEFLNLNIPSIIWYEQR
jgi:hypothetical protein